MFWCFVIWRVRLGRGVRAGSWIVIDNDTTIRRWGKRLIRHPLRRRESVFLDLYISSDLLSDDEFELLLTSDGLSRLMLSVA